MIHIRQIHAVNVVQRMLQDQSAPVNINMWTQTFHRIISEQFLFRMKTPQHGTIQRHEANQAVPACLCPAHTL